MFPKSLSSAWFATMTKGIRNRKKLLRSLLGRFLDQQGTHGHLLTLSSIIESSLCHLQSLRRQYLNYFARMSNSPGHWNGRMLWTTSNSDLQRPQSSFHSIFYLSP